MIAFPGMIAKAAEDAGMKVPEDPDGDKWSAADYPHFHVFCNAQLGRPMDWDEPHDNAKVIAAIPEEEIWKVTVNDLLKRGFRIKGHYAEDDSVQA